MSWPARRRSADQLETQVGGSRLRRNTVQLRISDCDPGSVGGLWPVRVAGAFGFPFEDFAFDHSGVGAGSACRVEALQEFADGALPQCGGGVMVVRGEMSCGTMIFE